MNKINLIETVTKGSHIRKTVDPGLFIGDESNGYVPGDILDANAVIDVCGEGGEQIQSDWNQTDNTQKDYIKNKPDLSGFITKSVDDLTNYYTKTAADAKFVSSVSVRHIVTLTQVEYDALTSYDEDTEYNII